MNEWIYVAKEKCDHWNLASCKFIIFCILLLTFIMIWCSGWVNWKIYWLLSIILLIVRFSDFANNKLILKLSRFIMAWIQTSAIEMVCLKFSMFLNLVNKKSKLNFSSCYRIGCLWSTAYNKKTLLFIYKGCLNYLSIITIGLMQYPHSTWELTRISDWYHFISINSHWNFCLFRPLFNQLYRYLWSPFWARSNLDSARNFSF